MRIPSRFDIKITNGFRLLFCFWSCKWAPVWFYLRSHNHDRSFGFRFHGIVATDLTEVAMSDPSFVQVENSHTL